MEVKPSPYMRARQSGSQVMRPPRRTGPTTTGHRLKDKPDSLFVPSAFGNAGQAQSPRVAPAVLRLLEWVSFGEVLDSEVRL